LGQPASRAGDEAGQVEVIQAGRPRDVALSENGRLSVHRTPLLAALYARSGLCPELADDEVDPRYRTQHTADRRGDLVRVQPVVDEPADESPDADPGDEVSDGCPARVGTRSPLALRRLVAGHDARTISVRVSGV